MLLTTLIFLPLFASLCILVIPDQHKTAYRWISLGTCAVELGLCVYMYVHFDKTQSQYQFTELHDWISLSMGNLGLLSIDYCLGIDGVSLPMLLLSGIVMLVGAVSSFEISHREKAYHALYLLLTGSIMGCFVALDFFLFYLFFEFMLLPMYFLIGLWGGPNRNYASLKFFIYTLVGSLFILLVMIGLYLSVADPVATAVQVGLVQSPVEATPDVVENLQKLLATGQVPSEAVVHTFRFDYLSETANYLPDSWLGVLSKATVWAIPARLLAFLLLFVGFAIKLPMVPLHTWLPDAHVEAPTPVSVVLAGVLLKIGGYGFYRIAFDMFPDGATHYAFYLGILGAISIVYGAYNALSMNDLKKMIAYSSVSHMGFVLLGMASLTPEGMGGAVYQLFSHGILSAMLFLLAGVLYTRTHDRHIDSYRGLAKPMPVFTSLTAIAFFASLGLPAFSGFIGEFFSLMGSFNAPHIPRSVTVVAVFGLVLGAGYFLWTFQKMFLGKFWTRTDATQLSDLTLREQLMLIPLAILALLFGIFPALLFEVMNTTIERFMQQF